MLNLPIGLDDFAKVEKYYYVDKTALLADLIDYCQYRTLLFTKPRRFGKSLNLSMVEYFFSNKIYDSSLFVGKEIFRLGENYLAFAGGYPVIHLSFKDVSSLTYEDFCVDVRKEIARVYRKFPELLKTESLFPVERENYENIANDRLGDLNGYASSLVDLSSMLFAHHGSPVVILVDEYDTPLTSAFQHGYFEQAIAFFRKFYSSFSKGNPHTFLVVLTGVAEIAKESIFSEMNNADVYSVVDEGFSRYFGFTKAEVEDMFHHFGVVYDEAKIKEWYGGYGAKEELYNPWSILNFLNRGEYDCYWVNTGSNLILSSLLGGREGSIDGLSRLLNEGSVPFSFCRGISYRDLRDDDDTLFSLLVHAGYLTYRGGVLRLPNLETHQAFRKEILSRYGETSPIGDALSLRKAIQNRDEGRIQEVFEKMIQSSFPYLDLTREKEYQSMVAALLSVLFGDYTVKSEVNGKKGRADILLCPKGKGGLGIVIEVKKHKTRLSEQRLFESADVALRQIKDRGYYQELLDRECKDIYLYAFIFDPNRMKAKSVRL